MSEAKKRGRRHFTSGQKLAIVRDHLVGRRPISDISDEHGVKPSQVYQWQKQLFEQGEAAFERGERPPSSRKIAALENQLAAKDRVIARLAELAIDPFPTPGLAPKR